jgi:hypothetical protein
MADNLSNGLVLAFYALQLSGTLGILALLVTVGVRAVKRSIAWIALCVSLIIYGLSYSTVSVI